MLAVHVGLGHQREGHTVVLPAELLYLFVRAGFLVAELVAREADDDKPLALILLIERLQPVVLRREAAFRGGIDYQQHLSFVVGKTDYVAFV